MKTITECKKIMKDLVNQKNKVTIKWIPGHTKVKGNERADTLANLGFNTPLYGPEPYLPILLANVKSEIKNWLNENSRKRWIVTPDCNTGKDMIGTEFTPCRWKEIKKMDKEETRKVIGILTGHAPLREYLTKIVYENDPHAGNVEKPTKLRYIYYVSARQ